MPIPVEIRRRKECIHWKGSPLGAVEKGRFFSLLQGFLGSPYGPKSVSNYKHYLRELRNIYHHHPESKRRKSSEWRTLAPSTPTVDMGMLEN